MGMRPHLTYHALDQMKRRHITHDEVFAVLDFPDVSVPSKTNPRARKLWKNVKGRRIACVVGPSKAVPGSESVWTVYDLDAEE